MARDYSAVNRIREARQEASVQVVPPTPEELLMDNIDLHLSRYYPIIEKLKSQKPNVRIEVLKKCSFLGRLTLAPSFTIKEYSSGERTFQHPDKFVIHEVTEGWFLKDAIKYEHPFEECDTYRPVDIESVTIGSDGRSWRGGIPAINAEVSTIGVVGNGDFIQSFAKRDPRLINHVFPGIKSPGNISSVNNRLSELIIQDK